MNLSDYYIVDLSGTILPASECMVVHKSAFSGEAVLSDSETVGVAKREGKPLWHFMLEQEAKAGRLSRV